MNLKAFNEKSVYIWRIAVVIILALLGFFGNRLYAELDRNQAVTIQAMANSAQKSDLASIQQDIRELRGTVQELNTYLRNKADKTSR